MAPFASDCGTVPADTVAVGELLTTPPNLEPARCTRAFTTAMGKPLGTVADMVAPGGQTCVLGINQEFSKFVSK